MSTKNTFINEPDRVITNESFVYGALWGDIEDEDIAEIFDATDEKFMRDPNEDYYQGVNFTAIIRRKSDGRLFGYPYWESISKHGEPYVETNGHKHGLDDEACVWLPVEPFTITGYKITETNTAAAEEKSN